MDWEEFLVKIKEVCVHRPDIINLEIENYDNKMSYTYDIFVEKQKKNERFVKVKRNDACFIEDQYDKVASSLKDEELFNFLLKMNLSYGNVEIITEHCSILGENFNFRRGIRNG